MSCVSEFQTVFWCLHHFAGQASQMYASSHETGSLPSLLPSAVFYGYDRLHLDHVQLQATETYMDFPDVDCVPQVISRRFARGLFTFSYASFSLNCGRRANQRLAPSSGNPTPPRISPRCHYYWMNIEYHYRFTESPQDNLPKLFLTGWTRCTSFCHRL